MPNTLSQKEKLQLCKEFGLDYLEMSVDGNGKKLARLQYTREERETIARAMGETGVRIHSICLSGHRKYPPGHPDEHIQKKALQIMEAAVQLADDLGIRIVQLAGYNIYHKEDGEQAKQNLIHDLRHYVELTAKKGILLGFKTMEIPLMDTVEKSMYCVQEATSPYLGVYPGMGNLKNASLLYGENVNEDIRTGKSHTVVAYLKETISGHYREIPFDSDHTEFVENIRELKQQGVRMFIGELWYTGSSDRQKVCMHASALLCDKLGRVFV